MSPALQLSSPETSRMAEQPTAWQAVGDVTRLLLSRVPRSSVASELVVLPPVQPSRRIPAQAGMPARQENRDGTPVPTSRQAL